MDGLIFDDETCELVPMVVAVQPARPRDYILVEELPPTTPRITLERIKNAVCAHYGLETQVMASDARMKRFARPRQLAMYLSRALTERSYPEIGRAFGGRDHSTVIHASRVISARLPMEAQLRADHDAIVEALRG